MFQNKRQFYLINSRLREIEGYGSRIGPPPIDWPERTPTERKTIVYSGQPWYFCILPRVGPRVGIYQHYGRRRKTSCVNFRRSIRECAFNQVHKGSRLIFTMTSIKSKSISSPSTSSNPFSFYSFILVSVDDVAVLYTKSFLGAPPIGMRLDYSCRLCQWYVTTSRRSALHHMTDRRAVQRLVLFKIEKTTARLLAQSQEMVVLSSRNNPAPGNEGLRRTASLLFDPLLDFSTVAQSTKAVAASVTTSLGPGGYVAGLNNGDTVSLLQGLLYGSTLH